MKDLKSMVKNFQAPSVRDDIIIDEFAKSIIDKVFEQLSTIFPAWKYNWKTDRDLNLAKVEWTRAFNENNISTIEQIKFGPAPESVANRSVSPLAPGFSPEPQQYN